MPKYFYTDEASKGAFLSYFNDGDSIPSAAKKTRINIKTARDIKQRSNYIQIYYDNNDLPLPFLHDRVATAPKLGRPYILLEISGN
jgi:hypothetical protein